MPTIKVTDATVEPSAVPAGLKSWILLAVGEMYANRERGSDRPTVKHEFADGLLSKFKTYWI